VPLKIYERDGSDDDIQNPSSYDRASVDDELALILGPYESRIGGPGRGASPYFGRDGHFSRADYGIYLVTRLTGYNTSEVKKIIDLAVEADTNDSARGALRHGLFVLDVDPSKDGGSYQVGNDWLRGANASLASAGFDVLLNETDEYVTHQDNVSGYASWGSNDNHDHLYTDHAKPYNDWLPGAIAETFVSTSARSFRNTTGYGQSLIADLIVEGVTGVKGYVYEPYLDSIAHPDILFPRYTAGYNLAESYGMASYYISWMNCVVGDPKLAPFAHGKTFLGDLLVGPVELVEADHPDGLGRVNESLEMKAWIGNPGHAVVENITVTFYRGGIHPGNAIAGAEIRRLSPGERTLVNASWAPDSPGMMTIYAGADPEGTVEEEDEDNNDEKAKIRILSMPDLAPALSLSGTELEIGDEVEITIDIENLGEDAAGFEGILYLDGTEFWNVSGALNGTYLGGNKFREIMVMALDLPGEPAGSHLIELAITATGNESDYWNNIARHSFWVNTPPEIFMEFNHTAESGETVIFNGSGSHDPDGGTVFFSWKIDGNILYGPVVEYRFPGRGTFNVTLRVMDNHTLMESSDVIEVFVVPKAYIRFHSEFIESAAPYTYFTRGRFNASDSFVENGSIVEYRWDFGDGSPVVTGTVPSVTHDYTGNGNHTVSLRITDNFGISNSTTMDILVNNDPPAFLLTLNGEEVSDGDFFVIRKGEEVRGACEPRETGVSVTWNISGETIPGEGFTRAFPGNGSFPVTVHVTDSAGKTGGAAVTVVVENLLPYVEVLYSGDAIVSASSTIRFTWRMGDHDGHIQGVELDFDGDGITDWQGGELDVSVEHTYEGAGEYTATVTVYDDDGGSVSETVKITILKEDDSGSGGSTPGFEAALGLSAIAASAIYLSGKKWGKRR